MFSCGQDLSAPQKGLFRAEAARRLAAIPEDEIRRGNARIAARVLSHPAYLAAKTVFIYHSVGREPDTLGIIRAALQDGKRICLPRCMAGGMMQLRQIGALSDLTETHFGIPEPGAHCPELSAGDIDLAVIPCVAANRAALRLGHGGGYYDRFLAKFTGTSLLLCREALVFSHIPRDAHDLSCTELITDKKI